MAFEFLRDFAENIKEKFEDFFAFLEEKGVPKIPFLIVILILLIAGIGAGVYVLLPKEKFDVKIVAFAGSVKFDGDLQLVCPPKINETQKTLLGSATFTKIEKGTECRVKALKNGKEIGSKTIIAGESETIPFALKSEKYKTKVQIRLTDSQGNSIANAKTQITLTDGKETRQATSDGNGNIELENIQVGENLTITANLGELAGEGINASITIGNPDLAGETSAELKTFSKVFTTEFLISDEANLPIAEVFVLIEQNGKKEAKQTGADGKVQFNTNSEEKLKVEITKEEFITISQEFAVAGTYEIKMKKETTEEDKTNNSTTSTPVSKIEEICECKDEILLYYGPANGLKANCKKLNLVSNKNSPTAGANLMIHESLASICPTPLYKIAGDSQIENCLAFDLGQKMVRYSPVPNCFANNQSNIGIATLTLSCPSLGNKAEISITITNQRQEQDC